MRSGLSSPRATVEAGEALGGLVYAVGTINLKPLAKLTMADAETDFRINALGAFLAVQAAAKALKAGAGEAGAGVVLFSTVAVAQGFANTPPWPWPRAPWRGSPSRSPPNSALSPQFA